ncbi:hypothetical protein [Ktedonospora formicarum]|uniref:hypothetical protein n=1 Tax=Ktedonospora formicarum TaxID=2778364 RepID=UPI003B75BB73
MVAELTGHNDVIFDLAWSPDERNLASSNFDSTVRIWDVALARLSMSILVIRPIHGSHIQSKVWPSLREWFHPLN